MNRALMMMPADYVFCAKCACAFGFGTNARSIATAAIAVTAISAAVISQRGERRDGRIGAAPLADDEGAESEPRANATSRAV
jgi:hypothetical protein